jgi:hypothetical protein
MSDCLSCIRHLHTDTVSRHRQGFSSRGSPLSLLLNQCVNTEWGSADRTNHTLVVSSNMLLAASINQQSCTRCPPQLLLPLYPMSWPVSCIMGAPAGHCQQHTIASFAPTSGSTAFALL